MDEWTLVVMLLIHQGLAAVHALMLVLHRLRPTGVLFYSSVKMPPWPRSKNEHDDNLHVTIPVDALFQMLRLLWVFFLAGFEFHRDEVKPQMCIAGDSLLKMI